MAQIQLIEATGYAQAASATSLAIGTGTAAFVLARHVAFVAGMPVDADAGSGNSMSGTVTAYDRATLTLTVDVDAVGGSGTYAAWTIGGERVIRVATGRGYAKTANFYAPRVAARVNVERHLSRDGIAFGASQIGFGTIDLVNTGYNRADDQHPLDELRNLAFDHRPLKMLAGDSAAAYGTFETVIDGTAERLLFPAPHTARWTWRDPMALLDRPALAASFEGTSIGAGSGHEGGSEMAGVRKQLVLGKRHQVAPQLANASLQLYFVSLSQAELSNVTIAGAAQSAGTAHGSLAALKGASVSGGTYHSYRGAEGTWLIPGSAVTGPLRVTVAEGADAAARTVAQLWQRLLEDWTDLSPTISAGDVTALDTAQDGEAGILIAGDMTIRQAADFLAGSAGADYWRVASGTWRIAQLVAPAGTPAIELRLFRPGVRAKAGEVQILGGPHVVDRDLLPPSQTAIRHSRYETQTRTELAGVALEAAADLESEWRRAIWPADPDAAVLAKHPSAEPRDFDSAFAAATPAEEEAERRQTLMAAGLLPLDVQVPLSAIAASLELGIVVKVTVARHLLDDGELLTVRGWRTDRQTDTVTLELLGVGI